MSKERSDGSTASYYELPPGATQLQHLISHRNMNAQIGEIFRACYRYGLVSHSEELRDAKKIQFYANAEVARLEAMNAVEVEDPANEIPFPMNRKSWMEDLRKHFQEQKEDNLARAEREELEKKAEDHRQLDWKELTATLRKMVDEGKLDNLTVVSVENERDKPCVSEPVPGPYPPGMNDIYGKKDPNAGVALSDGLLYGTTEREDGR